MVMMPRWLGYLLLAIGVPLVLMGAYPGTKAAFLNIAQTWTAVQTFTDGTVVLNGLTSGSSTLKASATSGGTATLSSGSGTVAYTNVATLSSLASIGTITTGVWNGTRLTSSYVPTDVAYVDVNQTWTKAQAVTPVALTPGAGTIAVDGSLSNGFTLTTGNDSNTLGNPTNLIAGQTLQFKITIGSGGHTGFATGTNYKYAGGTAPTWSTSAAKIDIISCWADTTSTLNCTAMIDVR